MFAFLVTILILLSTFKPSLASAVDEFKIDQSLIYTFTPEGNAQVAQNISITNNYSGIYAKEYLVQLSKVQLSNITATDSYGNILKKTETKDNQTTVSVE